MEPGNLATQAPVLEYDFIATTSADAAVLTIQAIPTHWIHPGRGLRYAVAIDNGLPQVIDLETPENSPEWATNVLRGSAYGTTMYAVTANIRSACSWWTPAW